MHTQTNLAKIRLQNLEDVFKCEFSLKICIVENFTFWLITESMVSDKYGAEL